jgi:hypothetical protein
MGVLATVLSVVGTVVSGVGTYMAAQSNAAIQEYQAKVADRNVKQARVNASAAQQEQDQKNRALLGQQLAQQSASGVDVGVGSPKLTRVNARQLARMDALRVHQQGEMTATNFETQAAGARMQADAYQQGGMFGLLSSFLDAGTVITKAAATGFSGASVPNPTPRPTILS